jgi:hypothetical protein
MPIVSSGSDITGVTTVTNPLGLISTQIFTTTGANTWTKPAGVSRIRVYVTGAGAGGGGSNDDDAGGGGGAGGTAIELIDVTSVSSVAVTVGAGTRGANNNEFPSLTGGSSSFGSYCSATGGVMSSNWGQGGLGGTATGGDINLAGGDGATGNIDGNDNSEGGGTGGSSFWGSGGTGGSFWASDQAGRVYGSGGGGGHAQTNSTGGAGANGVVIVEEYR